MVLSLYDLIACPLWFHSLLSTSLRILCEGSQMMFGVFAAYFLPLLRTMMSSSERPEQTNAHTMARFIVLLKYLLVFQA